MSYAADISRAAAELNESLRYFRIFHNSFPFLHGRCVRYRYVESAGIRSRRCLLAQAARKESTRFWKFSSLFLRRRTRFCKSSVSFYHSRNPQRESYSLNQAETLAAEAVKT